MDDFLPFAQWLGVDTNQKQENDSNIDVSVVICVTSVYDPLARVVREIPAWVNEIVVVAPHEFHKEIARSRVCRPDIVHVESQSFEKKDQAYLAGINCAKGKIIVTLRADGTMHPREIPAFIGVLISGADIVQGSRNLQGGSNTDLGLRRRISIPILRFLVHVLFGGRLSDPAYGYRAFWKEKFNRLDFHESDNHADLTFNLRALKAKLNIVEVPSKRYITAIKSPFVYNGFGMFRSIWEVWTANIATTKTPDRQDIYIGYKELQEFIGTAEHICVAGPSTHFLSGISYYTIHLANALASDYDVSVLLLRKLVPKILYPGRNHVGSQLTNLSFRSSVNVYDGLDWYWLRTLFGAIKFLRQQRPNVVIFQWWTAATFHSYLLLSLLVRLMGARVFFEFHEAIDNNEKQIPFIHLYANIMSRMLIRFGEGFIVHSDAELNAIDKKFNIKKLQRKIQVVPHGPYDHYEVKDVPTTETYSLGDRFNLLFFGLIRPYKGLSDLVQAFNNLPKDKIDQYHLTIVGEVWDEQDTIINMIETSHYRDHITFINRYVPDDEVAYHFSKANAVVLPYRHASSSGVLNIAMSFGLPVIATDVGSLREATEQYYGATIIPPNDLKSLEKALLQVADLKDEHFSNPHSWQHSIENISQLINPTTQIAHNQNL